ncbi:ion channel protein Tsx [Shewanella corallii]|uniref:Ion channel protein Tsx n=1 Tax=Shewanella corallii TaxID=560080 RepID=A0ABT0N158_9GAMM|nr:outer membrane protein OmpK [Shewanella corallii]MCL2912186.1 ion channel protein Tsx [Shewanella corallii]
MNTKAILCSALLLSAPAAQSEELIQWWDVSVTALYGQNYDLAPSHDQTGLTFETAGGWKYGDWFAFQDVTFFNGNNGGVDDSTYGEITTRFSMGKIFGMQAMGPVSDLSLALSLEEGKGDVETLLYGLGMDLDVPGFTYLNLNTYRRHALNSNGNITDGWQLSPSFRIDIPVGSSKLIIDGYIDWVFATDDDAFEPHFHFNPQIKYDLGQLLMGDAKADKFLVGIEYDFWENKFGVDGIQQNTFSVIAKYHF